jgi:molecular chaperone Hsp33
MADQITRALIRDGTVRVVVAVTSELCREAARRHEARGPLAVALGRTATAALLLSTHVTKDDQRVTLQLHGEGPIGAVTADAQSSGGVRVYAHLSQPALVFGAAAAPAGQRPRLAALLGHRGQVQVIRDMGMRQRYPGQAAMVTGEVDEDVESYLRESEQLESALGCEVVTDGGGSPSRAVGVLVQGLPGADEAAAGVVRDAQHRLRTGALWKAAAAGDDPAALAAAVVGPDETIQILDQRETRFHCPCSRERVTGMIKMMSDSDLEAMIAQGQAEVVCNFCRERYEVSVEDMQALRAERASKVKA